jgi:hypothetical protein
MFRKINLKGSAKRRNNVGIMKIYKEEGRGSKNVTRERVKKGDYFMDGVKWPP